MFRKQANESLLALLIKESIHLNSFNLLNWNLRHLKITPAEHSHFGNGIYIGLVNKKIIDFYVSKKKILIMR